MDVVPCIDSAVEGNDFELIPTVKIESGHPVEGSFGREFSSSISLGSYRGLKYQVEDFGEKFASFEKNDPWRENFKNSVLKSLPHRSTTFVQVA